MSTANIAELHGELHRTTDEPVVLIIGSSAYLDRHLAPLVDCPRTTVLTQDIYPGRDVDVVSDAHDLPVASGSVDGVVLQAVLEHVLDPWRVVSEVERVLQPRGVVDAAVEFYFLGRRGASPLRPRDMVGYYRGHQRAGG